MAGSQHYCIVCPCIDERHEERLNFCWCKDCDEPCSDYFIGRHVYEPASPMHPGPHGTTQPGDCRRCGLSINHDYAHKVD